VTNTQRAIGQLEQTLEALRSVVKLAPEAFSPRLNNGIAQLKAKFRKLNGVGIFGRQFLFLY